MGSSLIKDTLREIKGSFGRFFSIMMIVAIGVAFFAGVKASVPDMKYTADTYYDEYHLMDLRVLSTFGLTKEDVDAIKQLDGIEGVFPTYTTDVVTYLDTSQLVLRVHALPSDQGDDNVHYINRPKLMEGRLPQASGECVIEQGELHKLSLNVGDTITLESGTDQALTDTLKTYEYTIVGTVQTPYYLSYEKGSSTIGGGKVNYFIMIPQEDFNLDYYTEVNITVQNARELNSYEDAYFEVTDQVKNAIENIAVDRADLRFEDIKKEAQETIAEKEQEYETGKQTFEDEIKANEQSLDQAKTKLILGQAELSAQQERTAEQFANAKVEIANGKQQLTSARNQYETGVSAFSQNKAGLEAEIASLDEKITASTAQITETQQAITLTQEQLQVPNLTDLERQLLEEKLVILQRTIQASTETIPFLEYTKQSLQTQLTTTEQQLAQTKATIEEQEQLLVQKEAEVAAGEQSAIEEFAKAETKLREGQAEYDQGKAQLEQARKDGQEELEIAKEKLDKAKLDIEELNAPQWYVLDRTSHYSYMDYGSVADRMDGIAKVFPLFFFLVAALVCLTTMTRMVDEQRGNIGTLKALGYSKNAIALKFISYAFIASIVGSILGCLVGMTLFPTVIFNAWNLMYTLPPIQFADQIGLALTASFIVIGITVLAAYMAVYKELIETPALLMRPKAPRAGKKILLERITFLWKRFSFTQKVTARNLFRYKKRFFMTVIGISGCTALLVAGYGIQDSIEQVVTKQYEDILKYDVSMSYEANANTHDQAALIKELEKDSRISDLMGITMKNGTALVNGEDEAVTIVSPSDTEKFKEFVSLHKRGSDDIFELPSDGVIISEKLSMNADVDIGDTLEVDDGDGVKRKVKIAGIAENYVGHYMYMSPDYYKQVFHIRQVNTTLIATMTNPGSADEAALGQDIMDHDVVESVSFYSGVADSFADTISSLSFVVIVLVIAAGLLAFVVLYNLTNVNISERLREIATIKVLGFYDLEVAEYVYRENIMLTMIGSGCGLILGIGLHRMIMNLAEMESVMFGRNIDLSSFLLAFGITMLFGLIVNLVMYRKLKKIPMVESLKSVE